MFDEAAEEVARLLAQNVPQVADGTVEIKAIGRKRGVRTKVVLSRRDPRVDAVGACVGLRGCRIKEVIDALEGEGIDLVLWNDDPAQLICNVLQPAGILSVRLNHARRRATVFVEDEEQLSLATGRQGMNRDLASQVSGWDIEIVIK